MFDIYTDMALPIWALLFIQTVALPQIQALITKASLDGDSSKRVTIALNVVVAVLGIITAEGGFNVADFFVLLVPGVFITGNAYDKFWQVLGIRQWGILKPAVGIGREAV